jgi:HD superfamily phosphohydrolase YqeK
MINFVYRIKQFFSLNSHNLTLQDVQFIRNYLNQQEQILFFRMKKIDQNHSIKVAKKCLLKSAELDWVNQKIFVKLGLLHDIGKSYLNIGILSRILYVILGSLNGGKFLKYLVKERPRNSFSFKKKLFVLLHHGVIGKKMLINIGCSHFDLLQCIELHHYIPQINESKMLPLIREIDSSI